MTSSFSAIENLSCPETRIPSNLEDLPLWFMVSMSYGSFVMFLSKRITLKFCAVTLLLSSQGAIADNKCYSIFCLANADSPLEYTQFSGLLLGLTIAGPLTTTVQATEKSKRSEHAYTAQAMESVHFFIASGGAIEDAYFTSAIGQFRERVPDTKLNDVEIATLISRQLRTVN